MVVCFEIRRYCLTWVICFSLSYYYSPTHSASTLYQSVFYPTNPTPTNRLKQQAPSTLGTAPLHNLAITKHRRSFIHRLGKIMTRITFKYLPQDILYKPNQAAAAHKQTPNPTTYPPKPVSPTTLPLARLWTQEPPPLQNGTPTTTTNPKTQPSKPNQKKKN